jgi:hypothetical protein
MTQMRRKNKAVFQKLDARYVAGELSCQSYVLLFVRDGSISAQSKLITLERTGHGYRRTNALSRDETFDVVWSALRSGEVSPIR